MPAQPSVVLAFALVLGWSTAQAATDHDVASHSKTRKAKKAKKVAPAKPVDEATGAAAPANDTAAANTANNDTRPKPDHHADGDGHTDVKVALGAGAGDEIDMTGERSVDGPRAASRDPAAATAVTAAQAPAGSGWQVEIGPYVWASDVEANVSLGPVSTGLDLGFVTLARHTRYGAELLGEVRHGRFSISGDLMYGAADVTSGTNIASVMVTLNGSASSLLLDTALGYQVIGDDRSLISLEARSGVRYQRTAVSTEVAAAGLSIQTPEFVDDGSDVVVGGRAVLRPLRWLRLSGMFDIGVAGVSDRTWSATADASVRVWSNLLVTLGWRTLTMDRARVDLQLRGPRLAVQLVF